MKKEKGLGMVGAIIAVIIIAIIIVGMKIYLDKRKESAKENDIKSNMLLIQGACNVLKDNRKVNNSTDDMIGTKISEADNDIINKFKELNIINEDEYDKYYILTDENLAELNLKIKNEDHSYYITNYESEEVCITKGYNGRYLLSDM